MEATLQNEILLMQLFKAGDRKAYNTIYYEFYQRILYFCWKLLGSQPDAEEITLDTFLKLWKLHENFETLNNTKAFLFITARNACFDFLRHSRLVTQSIGHASSDEEWEVDALQKILQSEIFSETKTELYKAIDQLPKRCGQVIKLLYIEGKSAKEIAEELQINVDTVYQLKNRGLELLRSKTWLRKLLIYILYPIFCFFLKR